MSTPPDIFKPHPLAPLPETPEQRAAFIQHHGGEAGARAFLARRAERITQAANDPLRYGWETTTVPNPDGTVSEWLPHWEVIRQLYAGTFTHAGVTYPAANDILLIGGKRGSKTEPAAKMAVEALYTPQPGPALTKPVPLANSGLPMVTNAGRMVWCWIMDETASIDRQQKYIYRYLLPEHRELGKQGNGNIKYTRKTGFSERCLVLPAERPELCSVMRFFTYHQYGQDPDVAVGDETDFIWLDEPPPDELLGTLRFRNLTRNGRLLVSFNPKHGYTLSVAQYLEGARIILDRPALGVPPDEVWVKGCRPGAMPLVAQCHQPGRWVVCAHTERNPFNDLVRLGSEMKGAKPGALKIHFYGWPEKLEGTAFPRFGDIHVVDPNQIPKDGTNYVLLDPAGERNWFLLWVRVDSLGRIYIVREWPDQSFGEWALPSKKPDGAKGPAQTVDSGKGVSEYKRMLFELSGWTQDKATGLWEQGADGLEIYEYVGDPRGFGTEVPGHEAGTSLRYMMIEEQKDSGGKVTGPAIDLVLAPATGVEEGKGLINDALTYDPDKPLSLYNSPKLYVSRNCQNTIYCLRTWTGLDGEKGATKDPIDALKYGLKRGLDFVDTKAKKSRGSGGY